MKRLLLALFLVVVMAGSALAVGTASVTSVAKYTVIREVQRVVITITYTDDTNGTTTTIDPDTYGIRGWYLISSETLSGKTAPTNGTTVAIKSASGGTLFTMTLSNSTTVSVFTNYQYVDPVTGILTFSLSGNSVNNGTGTVKLVFSAN